MKNNRELVERIQAANEAEVVSIYEDMLEWEKAGILRENSLIREWVEFYVGEVYVGLYFVVFSWGILKKVMGDR